MTLPTLTNTTAAPVESVSPQQFVSEIAVGDLSGWSVEEHTGNAYDVLGAKRTVRLDQPTPTPTTKPRPPKKPPHLAWYIAQGEAGTIRMLGPFDEEVARDTQTVLGGKSRLYQAESKNKAESQHIAFLTRVARGHDSW